MTFDVFVRGLADNPAERRGTSGRPLGEAGSRTVKRPEGGSFWQRRDRGSPLDNRQLSGSRIDLPQTVTPAHPSFVFRQSVEPANVGETRWREFVGRIADFVSDGWILPPLLSSCLRSMRGLPVYCRAFTVTAISFVHCLGGCDDNNTAW